MKVKILMYHSIRKPPRETPFKSLFIKPKEFERQIKTLKFFGYRFSTMNDLKGKSVVLTFDDAYKNFIDNAFPVLEKFNIPAYVFVPFNYVGSLNKWDINSVKVKLNLMDWEDLRFLIKKGIKIGSHTLTHPYLTKIPLEEAKKEIELSKKYLEDKLGVEIDTFCYPYGDKDEKIEEIVKKSGYKYAFTTKEGKFNGIKNPYSINRIFVEGNKLISLPDFIRKILVY